MLRWREGEKCCECGMVRWERWDQEYMCVEERPRKESFSAEGGCEVLRGYGMADPLASEKS